MDTQVLVTGGAGFIGSHLATERIQQGYRVRALDALTPHVHGEDATRPARLFGDGEQVRDALVVDDPVAAFRLAAARAGGSPATRGGAASTPSGPTPTGSRWGGRSRPSARAPTPPTACERRWRRSGRAGSTPRPLYTPTLPLERAGDAYDLVRDRPDGFLEALVTT